MKKSSEKFLTAFIIIKLVNLIKKSMEKPSTNVFKIIKPATTYLPEPSPAKYFWR